MTIIHFILYHASIPVISIFGAAGCLILLFNPRQIFFIVCGGVLIALDCTQCEWARKFMRRIRPNRLTR